MLILNHPEVAGRSCEDCQKYIYNHETGELHRHPVTQEPLLRPPGGPPPPCKLGPKLCPKISPDSGMELSARNVLAYTHYQECKATCSFPVDPIVRRNASIIRQVEEVAAARRQQRLAAAAAGVVL